MKIDARVLFRFVLILTGASLCTGLTGCGSSPKPAEQQQPAATAAQPGQAPEKYSLTGRVISVDKAKSELVVDGDDIPGFMSAMTMPYSVKDPNALNSLSPNDQITADVLVGGDDVWLENITVLKRPDMTKSPTANQPHTSSQPPSKEQ